MADGLATRPVPRLCPILLFTLYPTRRATVKERNRRRDGRGRAVPAPGPSVDAATRLDLARRDEHIYLARLPIRWASPQAWPRADSHPGISPLGRLSNGG
ncbi:MAG: hypothetical protein C4294_17290, partial [Nitrospiraceae bacterium]